MEPIGLDCRSPHTSPGGLGRFVQELARTLARLNTSQQRAFLDGGSLPENFDDDETDAVNARVASA